MGEALEPTNPSNQIPCRNATLGGLIDLVEMGSFGITTEQRQSPLPPQAPHLSKEYLPAQSHLPVGNPTPPQGW